MKKSRSTASMLAVSMVLFFVLAGMVTALCVWMIPGRQISGTMVWEELLGNNLAIKIFELLQQCVGGSLKIAYLIFLWICLFLGSGTFLLWGIRRNRMISGLAAAAVWLVAPLQMSVFFSQGSLSRMLGSVLLCQLAYITWKGTVHKEKESTWKWYRARIIRGIFMLLLVAIKPGMLLIGMIVWSLLAWLRQERRESIVFLCFSILLFGIGLYQRIFPWQINVFPMVEGTSHIWTTVPMISWIFWLWVLAFAVFGLVFALKGIRRQFVPACLFTLLILLLAAQFGWRQVLYQDVYLGCMEAAMILFLGAALEWKRMRSILQWILLGSLVVIGGVGIQQGDYPVFLEENRQEVWEQVGDYTQSSALLISDANYGGYPQYYLERVRGIQRVDQGNKVAKDTEPIPLLELALDSGNFDYFFDRSLDRKYDTVFVEKAVFETSGYTMEQITASANRSGYVLVYENQKDAIYHVEEAGKLDTKAVYAGVAIGSTADLIQLMYPAFTHAESIYLDDYTVEDLSQYQLIYLSGFKYRNQLKAEILVQELAQTGIRIVIDMSNLPGNGFDAQKQFLGVYAQQLHWDTSEPILSQEGQSFACQPFSENGGAWSTYYVSGGTQSLGSIFYEERTLDYWTTDATGKIQFLGLNLYYHNLLTRDRVTIQLMEGILKMPVFLLPQRWEK